MIEFTRWLKDEFEQINPLHKFLSRREKMVTDMELENWFTYHAPDETQILRYKKIRDVALEFSRVILAHTPTCADQTHAIRLIRTAVMFANAAIACEGK